VVATGLGGVAAQVAKPRMTVVETVGLRTGTDNLPVYDVGAGTQIDLSSVTSSVRNHTPRNAQADAMAASGVDKYDIPAFLRRQSD
jgi:cell division protein FtsZ